jgi:hypothetical protein
MVLVVGGVFLDGIRLLSLDHRGLLDFVGGVFVVVIVYACS